MKTKINGKSHKAARPTSAQTDQWEDVSCPMADGESIGRRLPKNRLAALARPGMMVQPLNTSGNDDYGIIERMNEDCCTLRFESGARRVVLWTEVELCNVQADPAYIGSTWPEAAPNEEKPSKVTQPSAGATFTALPDGVTPELVEGRRKMIAQLGIEYHPHLSDWDFEDVKNERHKFEVVEKANGAAPRRVIATINVNPEVSKKPWMIAVIMSYAPELWRMLRDAAEELDVAGLPALLKLRYEAENLLIDASEDVPWFVESKSVKEEEKSLREYALADRIAMATK